MLITNNPRILYFNEDNVAQTRDIMDFMTKLFYKRRLSMVYILLSNIWIV